MKGFRRKRNSPVKDTMPFMLKRPVPEMEELVLQNEMQLKWLIEKMAVGKPKRAYTRKRDLYE